MSKLDEIVIVEPDSQRYMTLNLDPSAKDNIKAIFIDLIDTHEVLFASHEMAEEFKRIVGEL